MEGKRGAALETDAVPRGAGRSATISRTPQFFTCAAKRAEHERFRAVTLLVAVRGCVEVWRPMRAQHAVRLPTQSTKSEQQLVFKSGTALARAAGGRCKQRRSAVLASIPYKQALERTTSATTVAGPCLVLRRSSCSVANGKCSRVFFRPPLRPHLRPRSGGAAAAQRCDSLASASTTVHATPS